jgi:hypothetical protein
LHFFTVSNSVSRNTSKYFSMRIFYWGYFLFVFLIEGQIKKKKLKPVSGLVDVVFLKVKRTQSVPRL